MLIWTPALTPKAIFHCRWYCRRAQRADGRVVASGIVGIKHFKTDARVAVAHGIVNDRIKPMAVLLEPVVLLKSANPAGRIGVAFYVARERIFTDGRVCAAICVA